MTKEDAARPIEHHRTSFTRMLAANPNHFGTLVKSGLPVIEAMAGNQAYEGIGCVGYNPTLDLIEATIIIKRASGYSGDLCTPGSDEFVRFYVNYGTGWEDAGLASFKAHDIPIGDDCAGHPNRPLSYAVSVPYTPRRDRCARPVLPAVRAILSWQWAPPAGSPGWSPPWGEVRTNHVFINSRSYFLSELLADAKITAPLAWPIESIAHLVVQPKLIATPLAQLARHYAHEQVPPHRFATPALHLLAATAPGDGKHFANTIAEYAKIGINYGEILAKLEKTSGDTSFEQLTCVALDYNLEWATANFTIKRPSGFSGGPCSQGSQEHVAFWIDWDDGCKWTYLGTVSETVYDIASMPADGLHYWVGLPARLDQHRRSCHEPKIGRLRAVLSWGAPPSTTDPDAVPHWGNRLDTHFEVKPGHVLSENPVIDAIGSVSVAYINVGSLGTTVPNGKFLDGGWTDPWLPARNCAFGGDILIMARYPDTFAGTRKYRLLRRLAADSGLGTPFTDSFYTTSDLVHGGLTVLNTPDPTGLLPYLDPGNNFRWTLGRFPTAGLSAAERDGLWEIRLELTNAAGTVVLGSTSWHRVQLDNTSPVALIHIDAGGMLQDCNDFDQGHEVAGHFTAYDPNGHMGAWSLDTTPNSLSPPDPVPVPFLAATSETAVSGHAWSIPGSATQSLQPCGYVLTVRVWDNTIVNSSPGTHNKAEHDAGFCLRKPA